MFRLYSRCLARILAASAMILFAACSGTRPAKPDTGRPDTLFLERRLALLSGRYADLTSFRASGYFYYKDSRNEMNLAVSIVRDRASGLWRITFRGNLDSALWADILVYRGRVSLHFPLQKRLYRADLAGFDLYPFTRIHVRMEELLRLAALNPFILDGAKPVQSTYNTRFHVLYRMQADRQQKVFFTKDNLRIGAVHLFEKGRLRAVLDYSLYKNVSGIMIPFKSALKTAGSGIQAVLWMRRVSSGITPRPGDSILETPAGTEVREM